MTPAQFLARVKKNEIPPVILFLGQESYNRRRCRDALLAARAVEAEQFDMAESSLAAVIDDARAMSLFASERLIFAVRAETAMPRTSRAAAVSDDDEDDDFRRPARPPQATKVFSPPMSGIPRPALRLSSKPPAGISMATIKQKPNASANFMEHVTEVVEFRRFTADEAREELDRMARASKIVLEPAAAEALVEALAADVGRIAVELENSSSMASRSPPNPCHCWFPTHARARFSPWSTRSAGAIARDHWTPWIRSCAKANTFPSP